MGNKRAWRKPSQGPRLGLPERAILCLPHIPQKNSDCMAFCIRIAVGIEPLPHWVCKGQWTPWVPASLFCKARIPATAFYNSLPTTCPGITTLFSVYLEGLVALQREADEERYGCHHIPMSVSATTQSILHLRFTQLYNKPTFPPVFIYSKMWITQFKLEIGS